MADRFVGDVRQSVAEIMKNPAEKTTGRVSYDGVGKDVPLILPVYKNTEMPLTRTFNKMGGNSLGYKVWC